MFPPSTPTPPARPTRRSLPALCRVLVAALVAILAVFPGPASAESRNGIRSARADVDFRIVIPRVLSLRALRQPPRIMVTERDVAAGYVAVEEGVEMEVISNLRAGHSILIQVAGDVVNEVVISGLGAPVHAGRQATMVHFPRAARAPTRTTHRLAFRLQLARHVSPGTYDWPVSMTVVPV